VSAEASTHTTFCRICEALCGLQVSTAGDQIVAIRPDAAHPVSRGFACIKGTRYAGIHHAAERLNHPMRRTPSGWQRISWERALSEIGARIGDDLRRRGPRSLGMYLGNPNFFNYKALLFAQDFMAAVGSPNLFASHSIDCNNKLKVAELMYGLAMLHPVPDLEHTELFVCLGSNPAVSQMSFIRAPDALGRLRQIVARGGRVINIDPRRSETAAQVGEHLSIRPGTDAWLLLALARLVLNDPGARVDLLQRHARGLPALRVALAPFTPERAAQLCGVAAESIVALARALLQARAAAVHISTGVNMGPFGSIAYWMTQVLNLATGNLDRRGGCLVPRGPLQLSALAGGRGKRAAHTRDRRWQAVSDALPSGALAEQIDRAADGIRNLIVCAGDPAHSIPGGQLDAKLAELDTLVCIDLFPSESARHAHYLLPATDMLERSDFPLGALFAQPAPHLQFTEAVLPPKHERREEWWIFGELLHACGVRAPSGNLCGTVPRLNRWLDELPLGLRADPDQLLALGLRALGSVSLRALRERVSAEGRCEDGALSLWLIGRRVRRSHNCWMSHNRALKRPPGNLALLNPEDAARAGIAAGALVEIESGTSRAPLPVALSSDLRPGVIAVPHGWGQRGHAPAGEPSGCNVNLLIPGGSQQLEPLSGQAIMNAISVRVRRAGPP
jgi:formate dehydrogenase